MTRKLTCSSCSQKVLNKIRAQSFSFREGLRTCFYSKAKLIPKTPGILILKDKNKRIPKNINANTTGLQHSLKGKAKNRLKSKN